ncbi:VOC family protein [Magnetospirillum sulfuroxidans]|nr:VOC family protein [Magnetospirillum sulfuroxidans]
MYEAPAAGPTLRMAVATKDGLRIDQHFGQAEEFRVYDVEGDNAKLVESRKVAAHALDDEDPRQTIMRMLADCRILLVAKIGPTPQEQLAGAGIEATDMLKGKSIPAALTEIYAAKAAIDLSAAVKDDGFRLLHAMLRVTDMDRSLDFYTRLLGMQVLEMREHKKNQFTQAYLGYGAGLNGMALELVFNWSDDEPYERGTAFGHIAIAVTGITALCDRLAAEGVAMPRPPRSQRHGENIVAFVEDPDGNRIELVQFSKP